MITTIRTAHSHASARRSDSVEFEGAGAEVREVPESVALAGTAHATAVPRSNRVPLFVAPSPPAAHRNSGYPILLIRVNIGRYIAMTIPPMITPRMKIMTGSISLTRP